MRTVLCALVVLLTVYSCIQSMADQPQRVTTAQQPAHSFTRVVAAEAREDAAVTLLEQVFSQEISDLTAISTPVTITAYSARVEECNEDPHHTADMTLSRVGLLAVSRDLLDEVGLRMGQRVLLPSYGVFEIRDKMNKRYRRRVDILHATPEAARLFGKRQGTLTWLARS